MAEHVKTNGLYLETSLCLMLLVILLLSGTLECMNELIHIYFAASNKLKEQ